MRLTTIFAASSLLAVVVMPAAAQSVKDSFVHTDWSKHCTLIRDPVCTTSKHAHHQNGTLAASVELIESQNGSRNILRVTFPLGMLLVPGTRLIVDQDTPAAAPYVSCFVNGCMADYDITPDVIGKLKNGTQLAAQAIKGDGKPVSFVFSLKDFGKMFDGRGDEVKISESSITSEPPKNAFPGSWKDDALQRHLRPPPR